jgi:hypothetical protein
MKAIIIGLLIVAAAVFAVLPPEALGFGLGWGKDVLAFLKGALPVIAVLIGLIAVFIGIADIKDRAEARAEAKKEEAEKK